MKKISEYIKKPSTLLLSMCNKNFFWFLNDKEFLKLKYRLKFKKKLNLDNPRTFNEKLQWLKLYDRNPKYTKMVDKYEVKKYISSIIGEKHIIPTLGIYNKFNEIDFEKLPNQFVIKCTHDSGGLVIVKNKKDLNIKEAKKKIEKSLKINYYYASREWVYKNVKPRIIIEKFMKSDNSDDLIDYKVFCFNGNPQFTLVCSNRFSSDNMCKTYFNIDWELLPLTEGNHKNDLNLIKNKNYNKMIDYSRKIAQNIPLVRVDWYEINNELYFGETTFYPASGYAQFNPKEFDLKFGNMLDISSIKNK